MAKPLTSVVDRVAYEILIDGKAPPDVNPVVSIKVDQSISRVPKATVELMLERKTTGDETFALLAKDTFMPGKSIVIKMGYHAGSAREEIFKGVIVNLALESFTDGGSGIIVLYCAHQAIKLTLGRKSRYFSDKTDKQILTEIISDHGLTPNVADATPSYEHKLLVQYQAVDFDFLVNRAETIGMLAYVDDDKVCVQAPKHDASGSFKLDFEEAGVLGFDFQLDSRFQKDTVSFQAWDIAGQSLVQGDGTPPSGVASNISSAASKLAETVGQPAVERFMGGFLEQQELQLAATGELVKARLTAINGTVRYIGDTTAIPKLNTTATLSGFSSRYNGEVLITRIRHEVMDNSWVTTVGFGLSPNWHHDEWPVSAAPAGGVLPGVEGLFIGKVKKIHEDPLNQHRIQVAIPALGIKESELVWARLSSLYATNTKGIVFFPEIDDEVIVGFMHNDPRFAVVLGSLYSSTNAPPYPADAENKIKAIVTKNELKIELNDEKKIMTFITPGKNQIVISDEGKSIQLKDQNNNEIMMDSSGITLKSAKDIILKAQANVKIEAQANLEAKGTAGVKVEGAKVEIKAQGQLKASAAGQAEFSASGMTAVKAGGILQIQGSLVKIN